MKSQELVAEAFRVINEAIDAHRDDFPYAQLITASARVLGDRPLVVAVTNGADGLPYDVYTFTFRDGRFVLVGRGRDRSPAPIWTASRHYLEGVVSDPDRYIRHPEKLDLDWIKDRLGLL